MYWRDVLHDDVMRAHEKWLYRGRIGDGRLILIGQQLGESAVSGMTWEYAVLDSCDFTGARIVYSGLAHSEISNCVFTGATVNSTRFVEARVRETRFDGADLRGCWFGDSTISKCTFDGSNLDRANFVRATVAESTFRDAVLADTQLDHGRFSRCDLRSARLGDTAIHAGFVDCDLRGANLDGLRLKDTRFTRCRLAGITGTPRIEGSYELIDPDFATEDSLPEGSPRSADELRRHWERR